MNELPALRTGHKDGKREYSWEKGRFDGVIFRRVFGYLIDIFMVSLLTMLGYPLLILGGTLTFGLLWGGIPILSLAVLLAYHTLTIGGPRSATIGMRLTGVEVRTWDGGRPDHPRALLQTVMFYMSVAILTPLVLLLALFTDKARTLHEMLSGTVTVRVTSHQASEETPL